MSRSAHRGHGLGALDDEKIANRPPWCRRRPRARSRGPHRGAGARPSRGRPIARQSRREGPRGSRRTARSSRGRPGQRPVRDGGRHRGRRRPPSGGRTGRAPRRAGSVLRPQRRAAAAATLLRQGREGEGHGGGGPEQAALEALGGELEPEAGIEVERVAGRSRPMARSTTVPPRECPTMRSRPVGSVSTRSSANASTV